MHLYKLKKQEIKMKEIINHIEIKFYQPADNFEIAKLFYETVHCRTTIDIGQ